MPDNKNLQVSGSILEGFLKASIKLNIIARTHTASIEHIVPVKWYPLQNLLDLQQIVSDNYKHAGPIFEKIGQSMITSWYHLGPGKELISTGADFLHFQSSSNGYRSGAAKAEGAAIELESLASQRRGTVLIVDDEELVVDVCREMLVNLGFSVLAAKDGTEAVEIFSRKASNIDCVLLDLSMPMMDGIAAFGEIIDQALQQSSGAFSKDSSITTHARCVKNYRLICRLTNNTKRYIFKSNQQRRILCLNYAFSQSLIADIPI